jgi:hypothetical protein
MLRLLPLLLLAGSGCATAKLVGPPAFTPEDRGVARTVVIEPFFELAELQTTTRTEYARLSPGMSPLGGYGYGYGSGFGGMPTTVAVTRQVQEKPFFAKADTLVQLHGLVLREVQRRRPGWRVTSTSGAALLEGQVTVLRTIIEGNDTVASNRALKNLAFGFGLLIWPLQLFHVTPVEETVRVYGTLERFAADGVGLRQRLVKYPSQPDFAVNLAGLEPRRQPFGLDVSYEEGLLADERPRPQVLVQGFVDRLAAAVIAIVEEAP